MSALQKLPIPLTLGLQPVQLKAFHRLHSFLLRFNGLHSFLLRYNLGLQTANFEQPLGKMARELEFPEGHSLQPLLHCVTWSIREMSFLVSS